MNFWEMRPGPEREATRNAYYFGVDQRWLSVMLQRHGLPYPPGLTASREGDRIVFRYGKRSESVSVRDICATVLKVYIHSFMSHAPATSEPTNQGANENNDGQQSPNDQ